MKKIKKIFLPKWQRYFVIPFLFIVWIFTAYMEFLGPERGELGVVGFAFMTLIFLGVSAMIWLMTSGVLPAYTMEEEAVEQDETDSTHNTT